MIGFQTFDTNDNTTQSECYKPLQPEIKSAEQYQFFFS